MTLLLLLPRLLILIMIKQYTKIIIDYFERTYSRCVELSRDEILHPMLPCFIISHSHGYITYNSNP